MGMKCSPISLARCARTSSGSAWATRLRWRCLPTTWARPGSPTASSSRSVERCAPGLEGPIDSRAEVNAPAEIQRRFTSRATDTDGAQRHVLDADINVRLLDRVIHEQGADVTAE